MSVNESHFFILSNSVHRMNDSLFLRINQSLPVSPLCFYLAALLRAQVAAMQSLIEHFFIIEH
jgi:hypothetical protein